MEALSALSLPPGFGFHPTDAELISHYLKKKVNGLKIDYDVIPEIDIYKHEPWDLPSKCKVPTKDTKWHFFTSRDRKYPNGSRSNRATEAGYWKSTGKDRNIKIKNKTIGTKKTLVFHEGRPPSGKRSDWIMHEYYLDETECRHAPEIKDLFVLCRVTKRDGFGPEAETEQSIAITAAVMRENFSSPSENNNINNGIIDDNNNNDNSNNNNNEDDLGIWVQELFCDPSFLISDEHDCGILVEPNQMAPKPEPLFYSDDENAFLLPDDIQTILESCDFENTNDLKFMENEFIADNGIENSYINFGEFNATHENDTGIVLRHSTRYNDPNDIPNISKYNLNVKLQVNRYKKEENSNEKSNQMVQFSPKSGVVGQFDTSEKIKGGNANIVKSISNGKRLFGISPLILGALIVGGIATLISYYYVLNKSDITSSMGL